MRKSALETIEDELYGKPGKKHTGYPPDNIGPRLSQQPDQDVCGAHRNIGDGQTQPDHDDNRRLFDPAFRSACQQHDGRERPGTGDQRESERGKLTNILPSGATVTPVT